MISFRALAFGLLAIAVATTSGCGRPVGTVTGKVTYQNKAIPGGAVGFVSTEGQPGGTAIIKEDGTYEIPNILAGDYTVVVDTETLKGGAGAGAYGKGAGATVPKGVKNSPPPGATLPEGYKMTSPDEADATKKDNLRRYVQIPAKYRDAKESGLSHKVVAGSQTYDIDLK